MLDVCSLLTVAEAAIERLDVESQCLGYLFEPGVAEAVTTTLVQE